MWTCEMADGKSETARKTARADPDSRNNLASLGQMRPSERQLTKRQLTRRQPTRRRLLDEGDVAATVPHLRRRLAIETKAEHILARREMGRHLDRVPHTDVVVVALAVGTVGLEGGLVRRAVVVTSGAVTPRRARAWGALSLDEVLLPWQALVWGGVGVVGPGDALRRRGEMRRDEAR